MSKVDTNAAREFSNGGDRYTGAEVRLWVHNMADEIDRLRGWVDTYTAELVLARQQLAHYKEREKVQGWGPL